MLKLVAFDFDSTLINAETLDFLALHLGLEKSILALTSKAMEGKMDFDESLCKRLACFKGLPLAKALQITSQMPIMKGAKKLITFLKKRGVCVVVISGGFTQLILPFKKTLGFDAVYANTLCLEGALLNGRFFGQINLANSKGKCLLHLACKMKLHTSQIAAVGDGMNDVSMFDKAGISVAFMAKQDVKQYAKYIQDTPDLAKLIPLFTKQQKEKNENILTLV